MIEVAGLTNEEKQQMEELTDVSKMTVEELQYHLCEEVMCGLPAWHWIKELVREIEKREKKAGNTTDYDKDYAAFQEPIEKGTDRYEKEFFIRKDDKEKLNELKTLAITEWLEHPDFVRMFLDASYPEHERKVMDLEPKRARLWEIGKTVAAKIREENRDLII